MLLQHRAGPHLHEDHHLAGSQLGVKASQKVHMMPVKCSQNCQTWRRALWSGLSWLILWNLQISCRLQTHRSLASMAVDNSDAVASQPRLSLQEQCGVVEAALLLWCLWWVHALPCNSHGSFLVCRASVISCFISHLTLPLSLHCTVQQTQTLHQGLRTIQFILHWKYISITLFLEHILWKSSCLELFLISSISSSIPTTSLFPNSLFPLPVSSSPEESITYLHQIQRVNDFGSVHWECDVVVSLQGMCLLEVP